MKITSLLYSGAIRAATQRNDHGRAIELGLQCLGDDEILKEKLANMRVIQEKHEAFGFMTLELMEDRYSIYDFMMKMAKEKMDSKTFSAFYQCF